MAADQSQLEAAIGAVRDPEIGLTLGDLGLVRSIRSRRHRVQIEVALPVAAWPGTEELAEEIHRAAGSVAGVEEIELEFVVMTDEERAGLRHRLRAGSTGEVEPEDDGHGHHHAGHG
ncbi:MAG: iron-sulfur cluster assembly protein, partial [Acidimicrobiales bacterium]